MSFIKEIIYKQNYDLLTRISKDMFDSEENRKIFILKYHKKNYSIVNKSNKDTFNTYNKKVNKIMRKN